MINTLFETFKNLADGIADKLNATAFLMTLERDGSGRFSIYKGGVRSIVYNFKSLSDGYQYLIKI